MKLKTRSKMNKKKKIILLILSISIIFLFLFFFLLKSYFQSNKDKIKNNSIIENLELKLGSKIPSVNNFFKNKKVSGNLTIYYDDWLVESKTLTETGIYKVIIRLNDKEYYSTITVKDEEAPSLEVEDITILINEEYTPTLFVKSCKDNSNRKCNFKFSDDYMKHYTKKGTYDIKIIASDESYNETEKTVKLTITDDPKEKSILSNISSTEIDTKIEETTNETYKYGVKIIKKESIYYEIDENGNKQKIRSKETTTISRDNYNATTKELLNDAKELIPKNQKEINEILNIINEYRTNEGSPKISLLESLNEMATIRAIEIAWSGNFSHTRPNGESCYTINSDLKISTTILGENIAKDYMTPKSVMSYWEESIGSFKNIINPSYKYVGVGIVNIHDAYYWTLLFSNDT